MSVLAKLKQIVEVSPEEVTEGRAGPGGFEAPNLDALTNPDEAYELGAVLQTLGSYANQKGSAMRARLRGDVKEAQDIEKKLDRMYAQLPRWARW